MIKNFMIALQFLTIIPIRISKVYDEADIAKSASSFVLVGLLQGLLLIAVSFALSLVFHEELVIALMLLFLVFMNGGFHLDGLSDTFDALSVKSTGNADEDRQKRLGIMKGSTAGPIGVTAIIFVLALKYLALKGVFHMSYFTLYSTLLFMPVISKWTMVASMFHGVSARKDGLGKIFLDRVGGREFAFSTILLVILMAVFYIVFIQFAPQTQYIFNIVLLILMYLFCRLWILICNRKFGGLTGDSLGALSEITELIFLFMVIAWSRLYTL